MKTELLSVSDSQAIPATIQIMGQAIQDASLYVPLRNYAASLASLAPPHDFLGQLENIYNDVIEHWRYVRDPLTAETMVTTGPEILQFVLGFDGGVGRGFGASDCDDIAIALGALLLSVGFPVRIVTSSEYESPDQWSHVFVQAQLPSGQWCTIDPVLHPMRGFGEIVDSPALGYWDLNGNMVSKTALSGISSVQYPIFDVSEISYWGSEFGNCVDTMGYIDSGDLEIELGPLDRCSSGEYVVPLLTISPNDFEYLSTVGTPYPGMKALGTSGYIYEWSTLPPISGLSGPFRRFFRRIGRGIKRALTAVWHGVERIFQATKFGRWILRVKDRLIDFAVKVVTPLANFLRRYAPALAPMVAVIPGIGPALAVVLLEAGAIAAAYNKWGVPMLRAVQTIEGEEVEFQIPNFDTEDQELNVSTELLSDIETLQSVFTAEEIEQLAALAPGPQFINQDDPLSITPEMDAYANLIQAKILQKQASESAQRNAESRAEHYQQAALQAEQMAAAQRRYELDTDPTIRAAAESAQQAARATNISTILATQNAQRAAELANEELQSALLREQYARAMNDPAYKAAKTEEAIAGLELLGYQLSQG